VSSLDFALRIFTKIDMNEWTLRERRTTRAGGSRSYTEGRLWNEKGELLASMTQQCILRLRPGVKPSL
jgi:acyl-CoA thioesterase